MASLKTLIRCLVCGLLVAGFVSGARAADTAQVKAQLQQAREGGAFQTPTDAELTRSRKLFYRLFKGDDSTAVFEQWADSGFDHRQYTLNDQHYICLFEKDTQKTGRGFYLFSKDPSARNVLMIPHGFYDLYTRQIGFALAGEGHFAAIVWNTVHRHGEKKRAGRSSGYRHLSEQADTWDMARLSRSYFTAFSHALATAMPRGHLIQLHGFSQKKRDTRAGRDSDVIISNGTDSLSEALKNFSNCLKRRMPAMVRQYPEEVRELGGTQNTIGALLRDSGHRGFVHIEMSYPLRLQLKDDAALRQSFLQCMTDNL